MDETNLVFIIMTVVTCVGMTVITLAEDSEGISITEIEEDFGTSPHQSGLGKSTHTKDDYLVTAYRHIDDELWIGYKERGGSWVQQLVDDSGYNYITGGVISTSNGSVVVLCSFITTTYHDVYLFIKWPGSDWDEWHRETIYSGTGRYVSSISINDTDRILMVWTKTSYQYAIYYRIWDFENSTFVGAETAMGGSTAQYYSVYAVVNVTGRFHIFWRSSTYTYHWDLDNAYGTNYIIYGTKYYSQGIACLPNDRFVAFGLWNYNGRAFVLYQDAHEDKTWTRVWAETAGRAYTTMSGYLSVKQDSLTISMIGYCTTLGEEGITTWTGTWDEDETYWNNRRVETGIEDPDYFKFIGAFGEIFPRHPTLDVPWTQPNAGFAFIALNETGGGQDHLEMVTSGVNWSVDLTTDDPLITTVSLPNGITNEDYSQGLTKTGGTPPYLWEIQTAPEWLEINPSSGTLTGTCGDTGSYTVTVKLTEAAGRYDYATWTLKVTGVVSEAEPPPPGRFLDFGGVSIDTLMGALWWLFMVMAMFIAIIDVVMKTRNKGLSGGQS